MARMQGSRRDVHMADFSNEKLVDGSMEAATTAAWLVGNAATLSKQTTTPLVGTRVLRVARSVTNNPYGKQTVFTPGLRYRVAGAARSDGSAVPRVRVSDATQTQLWLGTNSTAWQRFVFEFVPAASGYELWLQAMTTTGTQYCEYDAVTVKVIY